MKSLRNEADKLSLIERINRLTGEEKALWGKMNVNQMVSHLVQANEMVFGHEIPSRSNFISRNILKPMVLYVLSVPKEVKTSPEVDQQEKGRKPQNFADDKKLVVELTEKISMLPDNYDCAEHPFFGKMSAKDWSILVCKHIDHHLKQFGI